MFVLEFESAMPVSAASYYSLVIRRDPYLLGRLANCDISLPELTDVSRQHLKLEVMRASDALQLDPTFQQPPPHSPLFPGGGGGGDEGEDDAGAPAAQFGGLEYCLARIPEPLLVGGEEDPLVLRITNLSKYGFQLSPPATSSSQQAQHPIPTSSSMNSRGGGRSLSDLTQHGADEPSIRGGITTRSSSMSTVTRGGGGANHLGASQTLPPGGAAAPSLSAFNPHPVHSSAFAHNGWWMHVGGSCIIRISFRPVVVSIARDYSPAYLDELETIYRLLGATCTGEFGPVAYRRAAVEKSGAPTATSVSGGSRSGLPTVVVIAAQGDNAVRKAQPTTPILAAHVCELIADDSWSLMALAAGYTIVEPTYLMEWYGCLAGACNIPLHTLPPPRDFSPHTKAVTYGTSTYLRPEPATLPFSLYAWPRSNNQHNATGGAIVGAGLGTSRDALFTRKLFFAPTDLTIQRNRDAILCSGGVVVDTVAEVLQVSRDRGAHIFLAGPPDGRRSAMNVSLFSRYVVVEEELEQHIRSTSIGALRAYSKQRKASRHLERQQQQQQQRQFPPQDGDDDSDEDVHHDDDGTSVANTSMFSTAQHDLGESDALDPEGATMRLLVKLYLLVQKFGWTIVPEKCLHNALLTNTWTLDSVTFQEGVVEVGGGGGNYYNQQQQQQHGGGGDLLFQQRHPSMEQHDSAIFHDILSKKATSVTGRGGENPAAAAMAAAAVAQLMTAAASSPPRRYSGGAGGLGGSSPVTLNSPQPRNPAAVSKPTGAGQNTAADEDDDDKTPSVLSEAENDEDHRDRHQRLEGFMVTPESRQVTSLERDLNSQLNSPDPVKPLRNQTATSQVGHGQAGGGAKRRQHGGVPPLRAFEAQAEHIHRNIQLLLRPSEKQRIEAVLATTRRLRALEPVDATFVEGIKASAEVQLRALEQLNLARADDGHAADSGGSPTSLTRSRALMDMWNECAAVVVMATEILSFGHNRLQQQQRRAGGAGGAQDGDSEDGAAGVFTRAPHHEHNFANGSSVDVTIPTVSTHRKHPAQDSLVLRPSTRLLRYPTAAAPFLGPETHRVQLNADQQLTAKILAPVSSTNLTGIAEKRRLFLKRYQPEEGEKRFALWMQSNGMQWTLQMYRQLEERKLTLLEMLQYE